MITQGYLNSEIDLAKRVYIYYTDKLLDILEAGNNDYQQWYRDSIQINYFLKALLAINLIDDRIYIGSGEVNKEFVVGLGASIREFLDYELKEIVIFGEQVLPDPINPPSPPIIIIKETTRLHWEYFDILITVDDPTTVALPFDIYVADRNSLMVTVNDNDPDNLVTPEEEGCHIIASTLYWHNYYELKAGDHLCIRYQIKLATESGSITPPSPGGGGFKFYAITTSDGVLDEGTGIITGTATFDLPTDCDISDSVNKPMIVLNPIRVEYTLSGINGVAFITFAEPPLLGDTPEIYYSVI